MPDDTARPQNPPQIHIDSDWKVQAQREKQKLKQKEQARQAAATPPDTAALPNDPRAGTGAPTAPTSPAPTAGGAAKAAKADIPPASFESLLNMLAMQALAALGAFPDPKTGQRVAYLDLARHHIDLLGVLEEKTQGNLTQDEADGVAQTLYELRQQYVSVANASRSNTVGGPSPTVPGTN